MTLGMKRFFLCFLIFFPVSVSADEYTFSAIKNASFIGYAREVLTEAYGRLGHTVKILELPAARSVFISNEGAGVDGELFRVSGIETKFPNLVPIPVTLSFSDWVVVSKSNTIKVEGWHSIKPYVVGTRLGVITTDKGTLGMEPTKVNTNKQLLKMLLSDRVDLIVLSKNNALKHTKGIEHKTLHILQPPIHRVPVYHFIHKKHAALIPKITSILQAMQQQGFISSAYSRYQQRHK